MKLIGRLTIGFSILLLVMVCGALLLFNWGAFGYKALSVPTGSMRPNVPPGSLVLVHRVPLSDLKVGDVINYSSPLTPKNTITHRIVKAYKINGTVPAFITKGDANLSADPPVIGGLVRGQAVWHAPHIGGWLMWSKTWLGIGLLVYIPALLIMAEEVQRLAEYFKSKQPYRLPGFEPPKKSTNTRSLMKVGGAVTICMVLAAGFAWSPASALLKSNTVSLVNNNVTLASTGHQCSGNTTNSTNVNVTNSSTQSASSGSATSSGNTNGGSATSGGASNSNSSSTTVTVTNNC